MTGQERDKKYEELNLKYPRACFGDVNVAGNFQVKDDGTIYDKGWQIYLGHSCDEWVIGGVEKAQEMAANLHEAIGYCLTH